MNLTKSKAALLAGCALFASACGAVAQDQDPVSATMIIYLDPSVQFFNPVVKGAQDAAAAFGVDLDVQYANNDPIRQNDLITFRTVLSKPGGGKAASNLQFSIRARVAPPAPKARSVEEPDRRLRRAPVKPTPVASMGPRFTPRATPPARSEGPAESERRAPRGEGRLAPGAKPIGRPERAPREGRPARFRRRSS